MYSPPIPDDPELACFHQLVRDCGIPQAYPAELLAGMRMDVEGARYERMEDLLVYCHRVAGVVGLMMCHVTGLRDRSALPSAAHLGIAMQITNICRDVLEDWSMGRLYIPRELLEAHGAADLCDSVGGPFPDSAAPAVAACVLGLLREADGYYRSGDRGLPALPWRCALAVRAARKIYADIGRVIESRGGDVRRGRAVVSRGRKLGLVAGSLLESWTELPLRLRPRLPRTPFEPRPGAPLIRFPEDVLPA